VNRYAKIVLNTALDMLDRYSDQVDRASNRVSKMVDRGRDMVYQQRDHTLRNTLSFAAGVGVGLGAALLFAPSSGGELRQSIKERVQGQRAAS